MATEDSLKRLAAANVCRRHRARALLEVPPVAPAHSDHEAGEEVAAALGGAVLGPGRSGVLGEQATRSQLPQTRSEGRTGDAKSSDTKSGNGKSGEKSGAKKESSGGAATTSTATAWGVTTSGKLAPKPTWSWISPRSNRRPRRQ